MTSGHDVADARLHREVAALRRAGLEVEVLGLGRVSGGPPGAAVRTRQRGGMAIRALHALVLPFRAKGRVLLTLDPDVVPAALAVSRLRRRHLVADVHEDYPALLADRAWVQPGSRRLLQRVAAACVAMAGRATLTVVADDHVPPLDAGCRERLVVRNVPDVAMLPPVPLTNAAPDDGPLTAIYVGDLRTSRGLRTMVDALAKAPGWELDLVGPVSEADRGWLESRLAAPDLAGRLRTHGRMPPSRAWEVATRAQVGLVLLDETPAFSAAVPTKLYEYFACGLAVLATPLRRVAPLVQESGAGVLVHDAAEASEALRGWSADRVALRRHQEAARTWTDSNLRGPLPYDELAGRIAVLAGR